jgi:hypothetical protein
MVKGQGRIGGILREKKSLVRELPNKDGIIDWPRTIHLVHNLRLNKPEKRAVLGIALAILMHASKKSAKELASEYVKKGVGKSKAAKMARAALTLDTEVARNLLATLAKMDLALRTRSFTQSFAMYGRIVEK